MIKTIKRDRGRSRIFGKGSAPNKAAALHGVEMYSQYALYAGTRASPLPPRKFLKIDAKILQFRGISTHYTI